MIEFDCSHCGEPMEIRSDMAGRRVRCVACDEVSVVPSAGRPQRRVRSAHLVADDEGLSGGEWASYSVLFAFIPAVNVVVSSVLYYVWRDSRPAASRQVNLLGFLMFAIHVLLGISLAVLLSQ